MQMLWAPRGAHRVYDPTLPRPEDIAERAGISVQAACRRLRKCARGELPIHRLWETREEAWERVRHQYADAASLANPLWGEMGLGPRKRLEDIAGPTAAELREFGP